MRTRMHRLVFTVLAIMGIAGQPSSGAEPQSSPIPVPEPNAILARLQPEHPRLLATTKDFTRLKQQIATNAQAKAWHDALQRDAEKILADPPSRYEIPDGLRLLATSRRVLQRIQTLGLLYRLDGDRRYIERAWKELDAAASFPDWNPRHFLDTAEMTHAFAIGYDWLFDAWSPDERATLRTAMVEKGIKLALKIHRNKSGWTRARHNWNQVCNGGIGMGALALADVEPELAGEFLHSASESLQIPMAEFAPDGAWSEGPGYWNYATSYNVTFLAAMETALGTDFGLSAMPGFADAGMFPIHLTGPLGRTFNYADGGDGTIRAPQMFWLARRFSRPEYAAYQRAVAAPHPLDLLWFTAASSAQPATMMPLNKYFRGAEVVTFRSAWDNRNAVFVGFKAGDNKVNHSHLDLGTFVLDALGVRWALDLGADNYNLPGYFGVQRRTYYRLRAEGHNTIVINPGGELDQAASAVGRMIKFESKPDRAVAVADLTAAYARSASRAQRGVALLKQKQVLVQDEVEAAKPAVIFWFMHTAAQITLSPDGTLATLTQGKARLLARLLSPGSARFEIMKAEPLPDSPHPERQATNEGVRKLAVHFVNVETVRVAVLLTPLREGETDADAQAEVWPLAKW